MQFRFVLLIALLYAPAAHAQTTISQIQGTSHVSPLEGQKVTVEGVVTGDFQGESQFSGFYLQGPRGDNNPATSDGIFVYQSKRSPWGYVDVSPGDRVRVSGTVEEYKGQTQISRLSALHIVGSDALPAPVPVSLPLPKGNSFERYEGMLVALPQPLVVTGQYELKKYGQFTVATARQYNPTNVQIIERVKAQPPAPTARLVVNDASNTRNPKPLPYIPRGKTLRTGSTVRNLTGIINYNFGAYSLEPTLAPVFENTNPRPASPAPVGGDLKIAAANVLNYFTTFKSQDSRARGANDAAAFARQSAKVAAELRGLNADVVGLMEVQNNGTVAIGHMVRKLNAAFGRRVYAAVTDPQTGTGDDQIKVALIYKPARLTLVGASISCPDEIFERPPLAQTFRDKKSGAVFTVVVNHFKSKSPAKKNTTDPDQGEGQWNLKRVQQAKTLLKFMETLKARAGDPDIVALGDFNANTQETPLRTLRDAGLRHLNLRLSPAERYSYQHSNQFGSLDHAFVTPSLDAQVTGFTEWHINADEPEALTYSNLPDTGFLATPYAASDHDPILIGLRLKPSPSPLPSQPKSVPTPMAKTRSNF